MNPHEREQDGNDGSQLESLGPGPSLSIPRPFVTLEVGGRKGSKREKLLLSISTK